MTEKNYITGIQPLSMRFWIEYEVLDVAGRLEWLDHCEGLENSSQISRQQDEFLLRWAETCPKKPLKRTPPAISTVKFQVRAWSYRCYRSMKQRNGDDPLSLPWLINARTSARNWDSFKTMVREKEPQEKTGFARFLQLFRRKEQ